MARKPETFQLETLGAIRAWWYRIEDSKRLPNDPIVLMQQQEPRKGVIGIALELTDKVDTSPNYNDPRVRYEILEGELFVRNFKAGIEFQFFFQEYWEWLANQD